MAKNKNILIAAAAGSGKDGCIWLNGLFKRSFLTTIRVNVDELLVVTFTNASAAEMRHRIGEALETAIDSGSEVKTFTNTA